MSSLQPQAAPISPVGSQATAAGSVRLLSVRHDFPTEWAKFTATPGAADLRLELKPEHYPFWARRLLGTDLTLRATQMLAAGNGKGESRSSARYATDVSCGTWSLVGVELAGPQRGEP